jgi:hypothetical protein
MLLVRIAAAQSGRQSGKSKLAFVMGCLKCPLEMAENRVAAGLSVAQKTCYLNWPVIDKAASLLLFFSQYHTIQSFI